MVGPVAIYVVNGQQLRMMDVAPRACAATAVCGDGCGPQAFQLRPPLRSDLLAVLLRISRGGRLAHGLPALRIISPIGGFSSPFAAGVGQSPFPGFLGRLRAAFRIIHTDQFYAGNDPYLIREVGTDLDRRTSFRGEVNPP